MEAKEKEVTRIAMISIIIDDVEEAGKVNELLHEYRQYVIGRMGIPYREKNIYLISLAVDAPETAISALTGRLGKLSSVSVRASYAKS